MQDCPKYDLCSNADIRCHICKNFSAFKPGASYGKGRKAEKKVKKVIDKAILRPGSGALSHAKGDIITDKTLEEVKTGYGKGSMSVKRSWLLKIRAEALAESRMPILDIVFDDAPPNEVWAIIDRNVLQDLLDNQKE